jgi:hypothetical protein
MSNRRRWAGQLAFPRYGFVPGETPHPSRVAADAHALPEPCDDRTALAFGVDLFNHGYFWEAHEVWEGPWRRAEPDSDRWIFYKALIRLAAAALKQRVDSPAGVAAHAPWCARKFLELAGRHPIIEGLSPAELARFAQDLGDGRLSLVRQDGLAEPVLDRELTGPEET